MRIVLIEDEKLMLEALEQEILDILPKCEILAKLQSVKDSIDFFERENDIDLIFSDIQLADGLSFEIFESTRASIPVVFCTAFDEYALEAFKANGIDYILKPFSTEKIKLTISKYQKLFASEENEVDWITLIDQIKQNKEEVNKQTSILVHQGDYIRAVAFSDIAAISLADKLTKIYTLDKKSYTVNHSIDSLQDLLGADFFRVSRQSLVSRSIIQKVSQYFARKLKVHPSVELPFDLIVSKAKVPEFLNWLQHS